MSATPPWFPRVGRPINPDPLGTAPIHEPPVGPGPAVSDPWQAASPAEYHRPVGPNPLMTDPFPGPVATIPAVEPPQAEPQQAKFEAPTENWNSLLPESMESEPGFAPMGNQPSNGQPFAVDGFCPVTLVERENWVNGDPRWGAVHEGQTYLFAGPEEQQRFLQNPERYAPALSGNDPVVALDAQRTVAGQTDFSVVFDGRLYLFSDRASLARFRVNPQRYADVEEVP